MKLLSHLIYVYALPKGRSVWLSQCSCPESPEQPQLMPELQPRLIERESLGFVFRSLAVFKNYAR